MSSSSSPPGRFGAFFRNVPPPQGSKAGSPYARFIPREELGEVESWKPGAFGSGAAAAQAAAAAPGAAAAPAEPNAEVWDARVQAARQSGYQDGYRDGMAALESFKQHFATQATAQIGALLDAFERQLVALDEHIAEAVARTAVQLARQVVRSELAARPGQVAQVAAEAVAAVMLSARHISVHVHPDDLPLVAEGAEEALAARGARLAADPSIERGGVRIASDVGTVDARIAERWAQAAGAIDAQVPWNDAEAAPAPAQASSTQGGRS
jgi:flagellar assembly protein FliH